MEENENMGCNSSQAVDVKYEVVDLPSDKKKECFFCSKCNLNLTSFEALENHFRCFHVVEKRLECFFCASCRKEYMSLDTLMKHLRREHTLETIDACDNCGVKLPICYTLPTHYRLIKSNKTLCEACKKHLETNKGKGEKEDLKIFPETRKKINIAKVRDELPEKRIVLTECDTNCNDFFQGSSTSLTAVSHHRDLAPNSQSTVCGGKGVQSVCGVIHGRKEPFLCKICELNFSLFDVLEDHLRGKHIAESIRKKFFCRICSKEFNVIEGLMTHLHRDHTSRINPVCGNNGAAFSFPNCTSIQGLTKPIELYYSPSLKQQKVCRTKFASESFLATHTVKYNQSEENNFYNISSKGEKSYSCDICNQEYRYRRSLTNHRCKNSNEKDSSANVSEYENNKLCDDIPEEVDKEPFSCEKCGKQFLNKKALADHSRVHVLRHSCEICKKAFSKKCHLREHLLVHTGEKPYSCDICGQKFSLKRFLTKHYRKHSNQKDVCNICPKENPDLLCAGDRHFCEVCNKGFSSITYLREYHSRTHTGEKPHSCIACGGKFPTMTQLKIHYRIHTGERPFECETCEKKFTSREDLKKHVWVHTGEKPYVCDFCGRGFTQKWVMVAHRRIHTGERPFECEVCQRGFIYKSQMKTHQLTHFKDNPVV